VAGCRDGHVLMAFENVVALKTVIRGDDDVVVHRGRVLSGPARSGQAPYLRSDMRISERRGPSASAERGLRIRFGVAWLCFAIAVGKTLRTRRRGRGLPSSL